MEPKMLSSLSLYKWNAVKYLLFDGMAVAFIILVPAMAHLLPFPLYYLEPMRLMLILAMVHTPKQNGYLLALMLPFCSWVFSGHPELVKMLIITTELVANVALFYWLNNRLGKPFVAMFASVILSKLLCYLIYWMVFSAEFLAAESGLDFLLIQVAVTIIFATYAGLLKRNSKKEVAG